MTNRTKKKSKISFSEIFKCTLGCSALNLCIPTGMIYGKGQEHTVFRAPEHHQGQFIKGKKIGNGKNLFSARVAATFLWDGQGSKKVSFLLLHPCQNTQMVCDIENNPLIKRKYQHFNIIIAQRPGFDRYWWGVNVEVLLQEFLSRQFQKVALNCH